MAKAPDILYVGFVAQAVPLATAFVRRTQMSPARFWVFVWLVLWALMNVTGYIIARLHYNNHFVSYIFTPLQGAAILWALSLWQIRPVARTTIRIIIPIFVVAWAAATLLGERITGFSTVAEPVYSILALCTALYTLVSRSNEAYEPVTGQDWFWICGGLALYFGALTVLLPLAAATMYSRPDIINRLYVADTFVNILACLCIANGFLCSATSIPSGSFFSPASSA
jgi:hypothetical protein